MTKAVNYTPEMEVVLATTYIPSATEAERDSQVDQLVELVGRKRSSIIAKLSRMGIYVPKARKAKDGSDVASKAAIVTSIESVAGFKSGDLESFTKATKPELNKILAFLITVSERLDAAVKAGYAEDA